MSAPTGPDASPRAERTPGRWARLERVARFTVPFAVSAALLAWIFSRIDLGLALESVTLRATLRFLVPLALFSVVTLAIEAQCLHRVVAANARDARPLTRLTAARIKAACYLLGVLNYALGAAGLSILLRRRTGAGIAAAVGMVFLLTLFDLGSVLALVGSGALFLGTDAVGLRVGVVAAAMAAIVAGLAFLRAPFSLGALEAVRRLPLLRAVRTAPPGLLLEVGLLRLGFVGCFVALVGGLFWAFEVPIEATRLVWGVGVMLVVSALPIAAGGLGTGQIVFVELFAGAAPDARLLAMSIAFSLALIVSRAALGLLFAPEFAREAIEASRSEADVVAREAIAGANADESTGADDGRR